MSAKTSLSLFLLIRLASQAAALNPNCAPGGNFDLSKWKLQLPIGSPGNPTTVSSSSLQGCSGYSNSNYFFTESADCALVMKVPGSPSSSGCVTTPNSKHCRTELCEANPSNWDPNASRNRLSATLAVTQPDDGSHGTVIGQIHVDDSVSSKPVCELYFSSSGVINMGVEQTRSGGNSVIYTTIGKVPVGTVLSYEIRYEKNVLSVSINGGAAKTLSTFSLNATPSYFKVGDYNQGNSPSDVHFFAITVSH